MVEAGHGVDLLIVRVMMAQDDESLENNSALAEVAFSNATLAALENAASSLPK
jgi:hypothetical protein